MPFSHGPDDQLDTSVVNNNLELSAIAPCVALPTSSGEYATMWEYNGSGVFYGFGADFNSEKIWIRLTVDSKTVFEFDCRILQDMKEAALYITPGVHWDDKIFYFQPPDALSFSQHIKIEAKATDNNSNRCLERLATTIYKET